MSDDFNTGDPVKVPTLPCTIALAPREIDTILAALRMCQAWINFELSTRGVLGDHLLDIATDSGPR